jgi:hypothetical protein
MRPSLTRLKTMWRTNDGRETVSTRQTSVSAPDPRRHLDLVHGAMLDLVQFAGRQLVKSHKINFAFTLQ